MTPPKLHCINKPKERDLLSHIPNIELKEVSVFGQMQFNNWSNKLILGDNLSVLKALLNDERICGKINLIYIDPPFSTNQSFRKNESRTATISRSNKDKIAYHDKVTGVEYLEFLRKRLILMRELLSNKGSIYIHIDTKIGHYVKILMDEVFGVERFTNDITRIKCSPKNFPRKGYGNVKDIILFYSKTKSFIWNEPRQKMSNQEIQKLFSKIDENGRRYTTTPLHAPGETKNGETGKEWKGIKPPVGRHWRCSPKELTRLDKEGLIEWSSSGNPRKKIYAENATSNGKKLQDIWEYKDPAYPLYPTEKNLDMLKMIISASSNEGDIVMDSFCGSGSTLLASEILKRRWVGIDKSKVAISTAKKRLKKQKDVLDFKVFKTERRKNE